MNKYHIFAIKKEVYNVYKNNEYSLFKLLYNLYNLNKTDLNYGITLYNQLCDPINKKKVEEYIELLNNIRKGKNKYMITESNKHSILIIKYSNIIYLTEKISNNITYILNNTINFYLYVNLTKKNTIG